MKCIKQRLINFIRREIMTQLQDAMAAAIITLQSEHGVTADQVTAIVAQATGPLQTNIAAILASEQSDEAKLADVTATLTEFTTAFAPAAPTPAPAPAPTPEPAPSPSPESAPDSAPDTAS
jgi:hypothetical protein